MVIGIIKAIGIIFLVLGIIILIVGVVAELGNWECSKAFLGFLAGVFVMLGLTLIYVKSGITPMDVYRGKTTLQYSVVDGVKIDSVVVWKIEEE